MSRLSCASAALFRSASFRSPALPGAALRCATAVALACGLTGCYTVNAELPGTLRGDVPAGEVEKVGVITIEKGNMFFLWGLAGGPSKDVFSAEIKRQVRARGADGVTNIQYDAQTGCIDLIIGGVTCGIVSPRSYKMTGDLVKIRAAPLPGTPLADAQPITGGEAPTRVAQSY